MEELNRLSVTDFRTSEKEPVIVVLDNVRSMHNIGSVFRTADAFRIKAIYLCGITATPPNREIHKTALGATESVQWKYFNNTGDAVKELKKSGYLIAAVEQTDSSLSLKDFSYKRGENLALVFGNEIHGVDDNVLEMCDFSIEIPQSGTKHSLNISVAAGIVLWDIFNKK